MVEPLGYPKDSIIIKLYVFNSIIPPPATHIIADADIEYVCFSVYTLSGYVAWFLLTNWNDMEYSKPKPHKTQAYFHVKQPNKFWSSQFDVIPLEYRKCFGVQRFRMLHYSAVCKYTPRVLPFEHTIQALWTKSYGNGVLIYNALHIVHWKYFTCPWNTALRVRE